MTTAVITFSPQGLKVMQRIAAHMAEIGRASCRERV